MTLPEREFRHPLARAVIEQRASSRRDPATSHEVAGRPGGAGRDRCRAEPAARCRCRCGWLPPGSSFNQEPGARRARVELLWELALFIEDGALSVAERKLRALQEQLERALEEGAEDSELERLMDELQQAMDEFLDELTRQAMQNMAADGARADAADAGGRARWWSGRTCRRCSTGRAR